MGEISSASTEQSQGVAQVGEAVGRMHQVTQQLVQAVAVFKLGATA